MRTRCDWKGKEKDMGERCPICNSKKVKEHITDTSGFCGCLDCGHKWSYDY